MGKWLGRERKMKEGERELVDLDRGRGIGREGKGKCYINATEVVEVNRRTGKDKGGLLVSQRGGGAARRGKVETGIRRRWHNADQRTTVTRG